MAEKPSVARTITNFLSDFKFDQYDSKSPYHPVFSFDFELQKKEYEMLFTSVSGHLMSYEFSGESKKWELSTIKDLFF